MSSYPHSNKTRLSPTRIFSNKIGSESPPTHLALTSPPPIKHWSQTCHETILSSNDNNHSIRLNLAGGADNGQFVYLNESISLLKNNQTLFTIIKGGKIDFDEIILEIDQHKIAGCTLADVHILIETLSINGKQIKLKTVKSGLTKDLRQFLDARFQKGSIDHDLQQTIRDNLYMRTVPCTTRPPRPGEINGQDYTFLNTKDFRALEKSGNLLESGVYKGHYYGTPRPPKEAQSTNGQHQYLPPISNHNLLRRSNSANEMFQQQRTTDNGIENNGVHYQYPNNDPEFFNSHSPNEHIFHQSNTETQTSSVSRSMMNGNSTSSPAHLSGELISCSLQKSQTGFGFTIIGGNEKGEHFLQIKDILPDGPAARDGKLRRGDILVYVNDTNVLGYSHTDVVRIFQSLSINDIIRLTVCRGYPLTVNFDDPQIDVVSVNGINNSGSINNLPNGGYTEYQPESQPNVSPRIYSIKIRKGDSGFGFTVADSPSGQRVKAIVDKQRCQDLCENDLLLSINGQDLLGKHHADVVDILIKCSKDIETIFVIRRGDLDVNNNTNHNNNNNNNNNNHHHPFVLNGTNRFDKNNQENDQIDIRYPSSKLNDKPRSKTPTPFGSTPLADTLPLRSRTPLPTTTNNNNNQRVTHSTTTDTNNNPYDNNLSFLLPNSVDTSTPIIETELVPNSMNQFDRQTAWSRSARDIRTTTNGNGPMLRSKTPGPEFGTTISSSYRANTLLGTKQRSKTPTAYDFSANNLHNSRSLQSVHPQYFELVVNLTLLRPNDGFGLRIVGGEEEKSQVSVGRIVPNSPAYIDGRLRKGDEIIKIDGHSTIRASHERVVQLMQQAKDNQRVSLIVRRYLYPNNNNTQLSNQYNQTEIDSYPASDFRTNSSMDNGIRYVTLQKMNDTQSFGFVIISSQNKAGATVVKIIPNSPADQCGQLHINDRILAVNNVDLTHMLHTDVVNLIKDSGRTITLKIGPPLPYDDRSNESSNPFLPNHVSNGIRPSSSSPMVITNGNHPIIPNNVSHSMNNGNNSIRNAFSHNPLNILERNQTRPSSRANGVLKSTSLSDDYFTVDLQRPYPNSSFGFSIRGGREFSIPLFILKLAENGPAARDGRMKSGDQIIEINNRSTYGMTHNEAISLIRDGGLYVRLLLRKTNAPPPSLDEVKTAMTPVGNGMEYYNPGPSNHWQPSGYT
jgi:C-terminal processing protease CtpA/Prc